MRYLTVATALLFAMGTSCSADATNPCSPQEKDVLKRLAVMLRSGDTKHLDAITLRFVDLDPHAENPRAAAAFDADLLEANRADIMNARQRYRPGSIRSVKVGTTERHVHLEGTEYFVDRIRNSVITVDPGGANITVASLVRGRGCWRLENFGLGVAGMQPATPPVQANEDIRVPSKSGLRRFSEKDYCTGATIYRSLRGGDIGTLIEGYRRYRDPESGRMFEAVLLQSLATGHVRGIWMTREELLSTYVDGADRSFQKCKWSTQEQEVSPLPTETPAHVVRQP